MEEALNMSSYELGFGETKDFNQDRALEEGESNSDSIFANMGSLQNCDSDITGKSKNMFQRSLSRKVSQQAERNDANTAVGNGVVKSSPESIVSNTVVPVGACASDMSVFIEIPLPGTADRVVTPENVESSYRWRRWRYGKQRSSYIDPWQILLFFATVSSVGTIILIYFTLSLGKLKGE